MENNFLSNLWKIKIQCRFSMENSLTNIFNYYIYVHFQGVQNVAMILNCNTMKTLDNSVGVIFAKINDVNAYILDSNNGIKIQL